MRMLIVEDEPKTAAYLQKGLVEHGFVVDVADQGETGSTSHGRASTTWSSWISCSQYGMDGLS